SIIESRRVQSCVDQKFGCYVLPTPRSYSELTALGGATARFLQDSCRARGCSPRLSLNKYVVCPLRSTSSPDENFFGSLRKPSSLVVSRICSHSRCSSPGSTNGIGSWCALIRSRKVSSRTGSPCASTRSTASPLISIPRQRTNGEFHSSSLISLPPGLNHITSLISPPRTRRPWKNFGRRKTACSRLNSINFLVNSNSRFCFSFRCQFSQLISLS